MLKNLVFAVVLITIGITANGAEVWEDNTCGKMYMVLIGRTEPKPGCSYTITEGIHLIQKTKQGYLAGMSEEMFDALYSEYMPEPQVVFFITNTKQGFYMARTAKFLGYRTYQMSNGFDKTMMTFRVDSHR